MCHSYTIELRDDYAVAFFQFSNATFQVVEHLGESCIVVCRLGILVDKDVE